MAKRRAASSNIRPAKAALDAETERALDTALAQHRAGELDSAMEGYRTVLAKAPGQIDALMNMGSALTTQGRRKEALVFIRKAVAQAPKSPRLLTDAGICFGELGSFDEAIDVHKRAVTLAPGFAVAWKNLGRALVDEGREPEAIPVLERAVLIEPLLSEGWFQLHRALFDTDNPAPAMNALTRSVAADPEFLFGRFLLGAMLEMAGDKRAAVQHFEILRDKGNALAGAVDSLRYAMEKRTPKTRFFLSTKRALLFGLQSATIDGLVTELGVRYGVSTRWLARADPGRDVHGFDSFQGLPEAWREIPKGLYTTHGQLPDLPPNVKLHVGVFEDTLPPFIESHEQPLRFANIDCDLYSSTRVALDHFVKRFVSGTILVFDEYLVNDKWREDEYKAFQEIVTEHCVRYEYLAFNLLTGQAVVKIL